MTRALGLAALLVLAFHAGAQTPDAATEALRTEMVFWESVRGSNDPADYRAYLEQYPNGRFAVLARNRIATLGPNPAAPAVSVAPAAPASSPRSSGRLPHEGDTWTYRLVEPKRTDGPTERTYVVKVIGTSQSGIVDQYTLDGAASAESTHTAGGYVAALGKSLFAPYLANLGELNLGPLGRVQISDPACGGAYLCRASAQATRREKVRTAAGEFDAIRVEVEHSWQPATLSGQFGAQQSGGRKLTVWYAPTAKRAVKYSSRPTFGSLPPVDTYFDLELVSYQVQ